MKKNLRSVLALLLLTSILAFPNLISKELWKYQENPNKKFDIFNEESPFLEVSAPPMDQSLDFGTINSPRDLDPHLSFSSDENVISQICEGLYKFDVTDPESPLVPVLATALPTVSVDGLEITIPLRAGVTFTDGTPFWAAAVKWNFDRLNYFLNYSGNQFLPAPFNVPLPATTLGTKVFSLFTLGGVPVMNRTEIIGPYIIKIVLNVPKASFINLLTFPSTFFHSPTSAQTQGKELDYLTYADGDVLIGTGPFIFQNYFTDIMVKFIGNPDYWQGAPQLTNLTFRIIQDYNALNTAVLDGDIDLYDAPAPSYLDQFDSDPDITLLEAGPTVSTSYMGFNGYMVNTTFRKAISYAINYSYLIDVILLGEGYRLKSPIPTGIPMSNYSFNYPVFDRAYAQSIMQSMGYGVGFTTDAQWTTVAVGGGWGFGWNITAQTEGTTRRDLALYTSDNLRYLGIDAPVVQISFYDLITHLFYSKRYLPMYMLGWGPDYIDPENYITPLYSNTSAIWAETYDYELEQLMLAGETTVDFIARQAIYDEIQRKLVEELYFHAWISTGKNYDVYQNYVKGWVPNAIDRIDFYPVYIDFTAIPPMDQSLVFGTIASPTDLDPHLSYDTTGMKVIGQICEGLYEFNVTDPTYPLVPVLATALPTISVDGLEITIPLRTGVSFHDGTPFFATTAKWNLDRLNYFLNYSGNQFLPAPFNVPLPSDGSIQKTKVEMLFTLGGVPIINRTEAIGPYTIKIVLNMPKASFINLLTFPTTFFHSPTSAQTQGKELDYLTYADGDVLIGTGPFIFQNYFTDIMVKFTGNPDYWQGAPQLTNLTFRIIQDDIALNTAVLDGDIDLFDSPRASFLDQFDSDPDITLLEAGPNVFTTYMGFNGYMVNTTFRKAISYAINYSYLIDVILLGEGYRLKSPIPTGIPMSNYSFNYPVFDRAYAQSIMQSMGYGVGFTTDAQWTTVAAGGGWGFGWNITAQTEGTTRRDLALYISDNLKYLGIDAPVVQMSFWDLITCVTNDFGTLRRDKIPMYMLGWGPDYIDPENYITPLFSNISTIWVNTWDHELEVLMLAGETTVDFVARQAIYDEIQRKLVEELYFHAWISTGKDYDVYQNYVHGWVPNAIYYRVDFYTVYIEVDLIPPNITILSPTPNQLFGTIAPYFELSIIDPNLDDTWYTIDGGLTNYTFSGLIGTINQTAWDNENSGPITIRFYANNSVGHLGFEDIDIIKDIDAPIITITSPTPNQLCGISAPNFDIQITETNLYQKLYSLNGRPNITFTTETQFSQTEWNNIGNGTVSIIFYAIDGAGNVNSSEVIVRKDAIVPNITIDNPIADEIFGNTSPDFTIEIIEENLDSTWYTVEGSITQHPFTGLTGTINQDAWDDAPEGGVTITFYAQDRAGNIGSESVVVIKHISTQEPAIPGYNVIWLLGAISVISIILMKKQKH